MANLLPPQAQKSVKGFYRSRFVFTGSLVAIVCASIAIIALLPVYVMVRTQAGENPEPATQTLSDISDREEIARARLLLKELQPIAATSTPALAILEEIFVARPAGTVVSSVSFKRGEESEIVIGGTSPSREDINAYRETLAKNPRFTSVAVPLGVLAGAAGARFTVTIKGNF